MWSSPRAHRVRALPPPATPEAREVDVEPAFLLRPATPADREAHERLFPELGVPASPLDPAVYRSSILPGTVVAEAEGRVVGLVWARPRGARLHVVHLITDPAHRRRGLARALMGAAADRARAAGLRQWMLTVKPENEEARALYASLGFRETHRSALVVLPWAAVGALPAPRAELVVGPLSAGPGPVANLGFVEGEIEAMAAWPGRVMLGAWAAGAWVGLAAFDPGWPGCGTCRVSEIGALRALLAGAAAHAPDATGAISVLAESPEVEAVLVGAGGVVEMRTVHLVGEVPAGAGANAG